MKNQNKNKIDHLVSKLAEEFAKIPNFDMTQTDSDANRLFNLIITKFADIQDFKVLYQKYFIPSTNRAIADTKKELKTSIYRKTVFFSDEILKENYFETIRLGYVGLFHKIENFVKDITDEANLIFNEGKEGDNSIEKFFKKKYNFRFNNWYSDISIHRISWICNCVKHYDGYPKKEPKFEYLAHLPDNEKIKLNQTEFYKDIDYVANSYFLVKLSQIFSLAVFKMASDDLTESQNSHFKEKFELHEERAKLIMSLS